jgi:hypothetical protein
MTRPILAVALVSSLALAAHAFGAIARDNGARPRARTYGVLSGAVLSPDGRPAPESVVVIVERNDGGGAASPRFVRTARGDRTGRFWIRTLWPSADYKAMAVSRLEAGEEFNPALQERILDQGQPLSILEGQTLSIRLLISGP